MRIRRGSPLHIVGITSAGVSFLLAVYFDQLRQDSAWATLFIIITLILVFLFSVPQPGREAAVAKVMASDPEALSLSAREKQSDWRGIFLLIAACFLLTLTVAVLNQGYWILGLVPSFLLFIAGGFLQFRSSGDRYRTNQKIDERLKQTRNEDG